MTIGDRIKGSESVDPTPNTRHPAFEATPIPHTPPDSQEVVCHPVSLRC
ncbi:MAG: hypothetical protein VKK42_30900 [Lyngbya sp.]|nr:hypothetical protein [Lyngbya sp.]